MGIIHYGTPLSDDARRACLYEGELFVLLATNEGEALCAHAQRMIEEYGITVIHLHPR